MGEDAERPGERAQGLAAAGGRVALASTVSRVTGFARTAALAAVLGTAMVGDAYNGANSFPNMVYELLLGVVLTSVFLPLLTRARHLTGRRFPASGVPGPGAVKPTDMTVAAASGPTPKAGPTK